jgi:hypothetical protein
VHFRLTGVWHDEVVVNAQVMKDINNNNSPDCRRFTSSNHDDAKVVNDESEILGALAKPLRDNLVLRDPWYLPRQASPASPDFRTNSLQTLCMYSSLLEGTSRTCQVKLLLMHQAAPSSAVKLRLLLRRQ